MARDIGKYDKDLIIGMLADAAKLWLAHDGLWFQAVESRFGMRDAIDLDKEAWGRFSPIEAKRIMKRQGIPEGGGIEALARALDFRLYSYINEQTIEVVDDTTLILRMNDCRVQSARERKGLELFPCKEVGIVEYTAFASAIDPRFQTRCLTCPPDPHPPSHYCAWEFVLG
ncbi:MAG TPA: DUF6125 family protein [Acidobacteriota bacterium]|nr:DUF6125 family protein [Acidobacteriota bacterium]